AGARRAVHPAGGGRTGGLAAAPRAPRARGLPRRPRARGARRRSPVPSRSHRGDRSRAGDAARTTADGSRQQPLARACTRRARPMRGRRLFGRVAIGLGIVMLALVAYLGVLFALTPNVSHLRDAQPTQTSFMHVRAAERTSAAADHVEWIDLGQVSPYLVCA